MKIAILGYAGSGKSHVSSYLSEHKNIPALHLDAVKYDKEWKPIDNEIVLPIVKDFMDQKDWIIDGFYDYLYLEKRIEDADKIILLLLPRLTCLKRVLKRTKKRKAEGYKNDTNLWFISFVLWGCRSKERQKRYQDIIQHYAHKVVVLKSQKEIDTYLEKI